MHTVRLRGPWIIEPLEPAGPPVETTILGDWSASLGSDYRGQARFIRRFGKPTNLDPEERVYLVVGEVIDRATIMLNGTELGAQVRADGEQRYEVTPRLELRNELVVVVESGEASGGIAGEVRLEIE